MKTVHLTFPITDELPELHSNYKILINGSVLTARDQAHRRIKNLVETNQPIPIDLKNSAIYYCGPTTYESGRTPSAAGPTTSSRMDPFTEMMLELGVKAFIGKGERSFNVLKTIKKRGAVYLITIGGAGAFLAKKILKAEIVAFEDLGTEAIHRFYVKDFPAYVPPYWDEI